MEETLIQGIKLDKTSVEERGTLKRRTVKRKQSLFVCFNEETIKGRLTLFKI